VLVNPQSLVSPDAQNTALPFAFAGPSAMLFANFLALNFLALNNDQSAGVSTPVTPHAGNSSAPPVNASPPNRNLPPPTPSGKPKTAQEKGDQNPSAPAIFAIPVPIEVATWTPIQLPGPLRTTASENKDGVIDAATFQYSPSSAQGILDPLRTAQPTKLPEQVGASLAAATTSFRPVTGGPFKTNFDDSPFASVHGNEEELAGSTGDQTQSNLPDMYREFITDEIVQAMAADGQTQVAACTPETAITSGVANDSPGTSNQLNAADAGDVAVAGPPLPAGTPQTAATTSNCTSPPNLPAGAAIPHSIHQLTGPANNAISGGTVAKSSNRLPSSSGSTPLAYDAIESRSAPQTQIACFKAHASLPQNPVSGSLDAQHADHHSSQAQQSCAANQDENRTSFDLGTNAGPTSSGMHTSSHDGRMQSEKSNAGPNSPGAKTADSKSVQVTGANVSNADTDAQSASGQITPGLPSPLVHPALSSDALPDPAAAQTSAPAIIAPQMTHAAGTKADALPSSTAKPIEDPHASANSSVQGVRFVQNAGQEEMRVGLRTESFGTVQVHTSISDKSVDVTLGSEHGDLKTFMFSELPALQSTLQQHDLRLQQLRTVPPSYAPQSDVFAGNGGQSRHSQQQGERQALLQLQEPLPETDEAPPRVNGGGLSIRA